MSKWLDAFLYVTARKPSGWPGRLLYRNSPAHHGYFRVAMDKLQLRPDDVYLEVGCGGGVLLDMALRTVQRACAIDHSPDMVELAKQKNERALAEGRVEIVLGDAGALPWTGNCFTCATGVEMLYYIENPMRALEGLCRVLKPGGRLVFVGAAPARSPLAKLAYSPWLRTLRFYSNDELASMLRRAGFQIVEVERVDRSEHTAYTHQLVYAVK